MVSRKRLSFKMFLWIRFYFKRKEQIDFKYVLPYVFHRKRKIPLRSQKTAIYIPTYILTYKCKEDTLEFNRENWVEQFHTFLK